MTMTKKKPTTAAAADARNPTNRESVNNNNPHQPQKNHKKAPPPHSTTTEKAKTNDGQVANVNHDAMDIDEVLKDATGTQDPLPNTIKNIVERDILGKRTVLTVKIRFTPELTRKHYGLSEHRPLDNPLLSHLRKIMKACSDVTGDTIIFKTFTGNKEFDFKHCLANDKELEDELLAQEQEHKQFSHVMMLRFELISRVTVFRSNIVPWMKNNNTMMIDHPYPKQEIETVRLGFIHSKHPTDTFRTDYQESLIIKLNAEINKMTTPNRLKIIEEETGDVTGAIPRIRLINQYLSWEHHGRKIETRGLAIECLRVDKQYVLKRIPILFHKKEQYRFIPFSLSYDKNIQDASAKYHKLLTSHKQHLNKLFTFPILGLSVSEMNAVTEKNPSIKEQLLLGDLIAGVERTPGTEKIGKWNLITTKKDRQEAEKYFDSIIELNWTGGNDSEKKKPFRAQLSALPQDYLKDMVDLTQEESVDNLASPNKAKLQEYEDKMESIVNKCESTMTECTETMQKMDTRYTENIENIKAGMAEERNEFRHFLEELMTNNNKKFAEIDAFRENQEAKNEEVDLAVRNLKTELNKLQTALKQSTAAQEEWNQTIQQETKQRATEDDRWKQDIQSEVDQLKSVQAADIMDDYDDEFLSDLLKVNPQDELSAHQRKIRAVSPAKRPAPSKATGQPKTPDSETKLKAHSPRYYLAQGRSIPKDIDKPWKKTITQDESEEDSMKEDESVYSDTSMRKIRRQE